ncbi:MAG TPA: hypothetical protein VK745_10320 [Polyangiaceae bacterium]|nr:hypothetical protein [Polyangiaceae bacterium]
MTSSSRISPGAIAVLVLSGWIAACGGKYDPGNQKSGTGDPGSNTGGSSSGTSTGTSTGSLPMHTLGDCVPGFDRSSNPSRPCAWVTEKGECFDTDDAACACICPTSGASICSSSLSPNQNGAIMVYCDPA